MPVPKDNKCVTISSTVVGQRGRSNEAHEGSSRCCDYVIPAANHPATKLLEQNARLKSIVRQLVADRGQTVAQYLVSFMAVEVDFLKFKT